MNRLILKYATPVTIAILAIFTWVTYRRIAAGGLDSIILLVATTVAIWVIGTFVFIYVWPRITVGGFKRIFVRRGLGGGPIPVNTIYAVPESPSQSASSGSVIATGTDNVLYFGGWLDVTAGPQVLHVPGMEKRYYSVQFTDPTSGANFAYVGKRTTGTAMGDFLLCAPRWQGDTPPGMTRIDVPHHAALLIGRVFVANKNDRRTAYELAKLIQLTPANRA
ncbi:DUF1254 domain-containing protein [Arthrobacter sp. Leaf137]|uniref:DUF1254 domain-containing protein n=1 Tax=Arthrobacter sp. Leaf137 TaxID=1736271 RepID=UPI0006F59333|nr:DUF1254 domain-containing protein [Arthrobacter sp. Leaf137]KQQ81453.1 hypothetical protein ASF64_12200 [Arthrobacter sp. Leaf137]